MLGSERPSQATVPVLVILLGLAVAVLTFNTTRSAEESQRDSQFSQNASRYAHRLADGLAQQVDLLRFLATLYEREGELRTRSSGRFEMRLSEDNLRHFVDPVLSTDPRYAPLATVAWVQHIGPDELAEYELARRVEQPDFRVRGRLNAAVDPGSAHDVVDQSYSRLSHEHADGFDLASDGVLADTLEAAILRRTAALSRPVEPFGAAAPSALPDGVLVAIPVFFPGGAARAPDGRPPLRGFIVGMFSLHEMLELAVAADAHDPDAQEVHLRLKRKGTVFAENGREALPGDGPTYHTEMFDQLWEIEVRPVSLPALTIDEFLARPSTLLTASVGIMMLLFLWIAWTLSRRHHVIQQRVAEQTAELRQKNLVLEGKERELHDVNRRLLEMSNTDPLTGILNRRAFEVQLDKERERAQRTGVPFGLLIFDVDQFKDFNDRYGHAAGDEVLRRVAGIINAEARRIDTVARYGGEEFVVLATGTDAAGLLALGERIRGRIQDAAVSHASAPKGVITVSGGGSLSSPALGHDPKLAFEVADRCLYQAKSTGRNRVVMVM